MDSSCNTQELLGACVEKHRDRYVNIITNTILNTNLCLSIMII